MQRGRTKRSLMALRRVRVVVEPAGIPVHLRHWPTTNFILVLMCTPHLAHSLRECPDLRDPGTRSCLMSACERLADKTAYGRQRRMI